MALIGIFRHSPWLMATTHGLQRNNGRRYLFGMLNHIFNRPDPSRIKEVGADRACAEWLLRCGAHVKWLDEAHWQKDYNLLPQDTSRSYRIGEINADDAAVMFIGFQHLDGLRHVRRARFHHCAYFDDSCVRQLALIKDCLHYLEISSCDVSDVGLGHLTSLTLLKTLLLYDLPEVRNKMKCYEQLRSSLPECEIVYKDIESSKNT